jgi:hypothetical protein
MPKTLKASRVDKCNGCELCVLEAQRQLGRVGLEGSLIRVFKNTNPDNGSLQHNLEIDPRMNSLGIDKIKNLCPKQVFDIVEEE